MINFDDVTRENIVNIKVKKKKKSIKEHNPQNNNSPCHWIRKNKYNT